MPSTIQIVAGVLGNVLEWYDFALFGYFSDIIAQVFFPPSDNDSNLVQSFAVFGGAFLMRPIGGMTIGYIGDKYGRKQALTISLFLMAFPTFCMGLLPTYESVGNLAIFLLAALRLLQGMSVGGQLPASLVYTVEQHDPGSWGFYGSLVMVASNVGTLLGNIVGAMMRSTLTQEELVSWGWRIPFLSGILIGVVALYVKFYGEEVHSTHVEGDAGHNPIKEAFHFKNCRSLSSATLSPSIWAGGFYLTFVWMAIYMEALLKPPVPNAFWVNASSMFFGSTCMLPIFGHLSDLIGRVKIMYTGAILSAVLGPILLYIIGSTKNSFVAFLCQTALGVTVSMFGGPMCAWIVEIFPRRIRLTSASLGYDLAHATTGGFSPLMATILFNNGGTFAPGILYPIFSILSLIGVTLMQCSKPNPSDADDMGQRSGVEDNGDLELFQTEETERENEIRPIT